MSEGRNAKGQDRELTEHLETYLDELEWWYNNHDNPFLFRDTLTRLLAFGNLEYMTLTT